VIVQHGAAVFERLLRSLIFFKRKHDLFQRSALLDHRSPCVFIRHGVGLGQLRREKIVTFFNSNEFFQHSFSYSLC
jgi:hypothetical protein